MIKLEIEFIFCSEVCVDVIGGIADSDGASLADDETRLEIDNAPPPSVLTVDLGSFGCGNIKEGWLVLVQ